MPLLGEEERKKGVGGEYDGKLRKPKPRPGIPASSINACLALLPMQAMPGVMGVKQQVESGPKFKPSRE